ncbi:hypothetical protein NYV18_25870, partial [Escherichia coli]|nr:hypothetical protein [Escherichia coli]
CGLHPSQHREWPAGLHEVGDKATSLVSLGDLSDGPPRPDRTVVSGDENFTELVEAISPKDVISIMESQPELHLDATLNESSSQQVQRRDSDSPTNKQRSSTGLHCIKVKPATEWT